MTKTKINQSPRLARTMRLLGAGLAAVLISITSFSQSPSPAPSPSSEDRFTIRGSFEVGGRYVDETGFENKFRSDLNYKSGVRIFDSSVVIEDNDENAGGYKAFDSLLLMASGWGADPTGYFRANVEHDGFYRFDTTVRSVKYFNALNNHAIGETKISYDRYNTKRDFGDFDLTIFPENRKLRFRLGGAYNVSEGPYVYTTRQSNAFPFYANGDVRAYDFRAGADGSFFGFNLSATYGHRRFKDRTTFSLTGPEEGSNIDNYDFISAIRNSPINGKTDFGVFSVQRSFADKFDFTARILHSFTSTEIRWEEISRFFYNSPTVITNELLNISGDTSRPQTRGDLGMTWRATDKLRISNTFTYDGFNLNGGNLYLLASTRSPTRQQNYTFTRYRRYMNLIEGDYQFNNRFAVNLGYRYTQREFSLLWNGLNLIPVPPTPVDGSGHLEEGENTTHTIVAGTRIKPTNNWAIYADIESGEADNVFTRAGNADFTNFRIRSQAQFDKVAANVSYISRDNDIPTDTSRPVPRITDSKSRIFSATVDWNPMYALNLSGGYTYTYLTSKATVNFPTTFIDSLSEYFVRDSYFFINGTVRPHPRVQFFGSYRWDHDGGQGDTAIPPLAGTYLLGAYKYDFKMPELGVSFKVNRYIDWNVGYQYYDYDEEPVQNVQWAVPFQNYNAHMPYMSLRIYLGKASVDR